jgi:hypothetical protein
VKKPDPQLIKDLYDIVGAIQASKRREVADQIIRLQSYVGSTDDLFVDRRKVAWAPGGKARTTIEARAQKPKPAKKPNCRVTWRNGGSVLCTSEEAAEIVKKTPATLAVYLSKGKGRYDCVIDDAIVTVQRI